MAIKNFKTRNGIDVDTYTLPNTVIQATVKTNSITTIDTIPMNSFISAEYLVTITQGSKVRTSKVIMHEDGTSVDMTEYGITETGGAIAGVVVSATTSSTNAVLQVTITDAATTIARVKMSRNLNVIFTPVAPDAPTIGTATAGPEQASITFTAPYDNGGAAITSYRATSTPGSITGTASSSPVTVSGLTGATAYTFVIAAINAAGTSVASSASNSVTPTFIPAKAMFWAGGGYTSTIRSVEKLLASNETVSVLTATLPTYRVLTRGASNSGVAGYVAGGWQHGSVGGVANTEKFDFSSEGRTTITTSLFTFGQMALASNSGSAMYGFGGTTSSGGGNRAMAKLTFSNDTESALTQPSASTFGLMAGFANSGTAAYFGGGQTSNPTSYSDDLYKVPFSTEVSSYVSALRLGVSKGKGISGLSNNGVAGYFAGGELSSGSASNSIQKISFSPESKSNLAAVLSISRSASDGSSNSGVAGYISGNGNNTIEKLTYSTEVMSSISATLNYSKNGMGAFANSGTL